MTARHHHFIPQGYLKGFTKGSGKKSKLAVIDLKERKHFETIPRNVGGVRDFNRVDIEGVDQNFVESTMSEFEEAAATALKKLDKGNSFEDEIRELILSLVGLLAIRSPERREHWRQFQAQIAERIMNLTLATKERWESQMRQMDENQGKSQNEVSYEDIKELHESKAYTIKVAREHHIHMEFVGLEAILPCLSSRNWLVVRATEDTGPFITSDNPVNLTWNEPEKIPPFYRASPGFGMKDTQVYFPVTKNVAVIGEFDGPNGIIVGSKGLVSALNTRQLHFVHKQIYAPKLRFYYRAANDGINEGNQLLRQIVA